MPRSLRIIHLAVLLLVFARLCPAQIVINEIHYHPVEEPAFDASGNPVLDLSEDVHEFVELHNRGSSTVNLAGWELDDGIRYVFPANTTIPAGGYRVVARNPARMAIAYAGLTNVLGPYTGVLSNASDTVKLKDAAGAVVDSVGYEAAFPWPVSADALGAGSNFTGLNHYLYQYKGRSLERVSATALSNDPANWIASPLAPGPSPGAANSGTRLVPKPVVIRYTMLQQSDEASVIRAGQAVRGDVEFSGTAGLSNVELEWFVDDIESTGEVRSIIPMTNLGGGRWTTSSAIPGQIDRSIVRWRIRANRGTGMENVSPRADDPQIAPIGAGGAREAWHAYFVEPARSSPRPIYDFFISNANVATLDSNISQSPRRVQTNGYPRDDPKDGYFPGDPDYNPAFYPAAGQPHWDGIVPAVFVRSGVVYDIIARYHGSRYRRGPGLNSWKFNFPATKLMDGKQRILVTEKTTPSTVLGFALFHEAGLPAGYSQFVQFCKNGDATGITRGELSDADEETIQQYQRELKDANPQSPPSFTGLGIVYKSKGLDGTEGPYGWANGQPMPGSGVWSSLDRYIWTFSSQLNDWRGSVPMKSMVDAMWAARGDVGQVAYPSNYASQSHSNNTSVPVNIATLRAYLSQNWDVDKMLSYLAIRNWCSPWDDKFHNYYVYLQPDGRWTMMPWDLDGEMSAGPTGDAGYENSIFAGRKNDLAGSYANNSRGPNWFKDNFLRAYEAEFKERMFILNNTLLSPANVAAVASANGTTVPNVTWLNGRFASINAQVGLGSWEAPEQPVNVTPASGSGIVPPASLTASAYAHTSGNTVGPNAHAKTRWEIRRSDGTYRKPVFKLTTTTNLTALPVPFELLEFGQSYAWRVTYYDAKDHPSVPSAETTFGFGPQPSNVTLINFSDTWKYNHSDSFANNAWAQPAFNDAAWPSGQGVLAFETATLEPIRTVLPDPRQLAPAGRAYYFRRTFNFPGNPATATVRIRHLIDDGCVIWINGQRVHRYLMNDQANYATADSATGTPPGGDAVYQFADAVTGTPTWAWFDPRPFMVQGTNTIAVEVHQTNGTSSDIVMGLEMTANVITSGGDVALNEILADNRAAVANGASRPDYVEIRNNTAAPVSLNGWSLSDDVLVPNRFVFPANTTIPAAGSIVVWCDSRFEEPGLHTGFGLSLNGQTLALFQGANVRDFVTFGPQAPDVPIGRIPDGVGNWTAIIPSPGAINTARALGSPTTLKINEWMANPAYGEDWFELYNPEPNPVPLGGLWLSDTAGSAITQIPPNSFIAGGGFARFEADGVATGRNSANFKLSTSGDNLLLYAANGTTLLNSVSFGSQGLDVSAGRRPDGAAATVTFAGTASPAASNWSRSAIVINEALANSTAPEQDTIELHNPTGSPVNVGNWWLSDDRHSRRKFQFPANTSIAAGDYLNVLESSFNTGANAFSLSSLGDEIVLTEVDGAGNETGFRAQVSFGASLENVSFGRITTVGGPEFWPLTGRSFGSANTAPLIGPIVINELHYHPPDLAGADNARDEFVELHNLSGAPVSLAGWRLKGESDFAFPAGAVLRPGDYILVVGFNPATDTASLAAFRSVLNVPASVPIYGPFSPKLPNSTANVELAMPYTGTAVNVDKVVYRDIAPWATSADGSGPSLQRQSRAIIGNDPSTWIGATPTPGAVNTGQSAITDNDQDGLPNSWEQTHGLDPFDAADAFWDLDGDGSSNLAEFIAGTSPTDPADVFTATVEQDSGPMKICFPAKAGKTYTIQFKNALTDEVWQKLADIPAQSTDTVIEQADPAGVQQRRFYRAVTPQQP